MTIDWGAGRYEIYGEKLLPAAQAAVDAAAVRPGERVLDVGCGTGNAALLAADRGAEVAAVDPAARLLQVTAERARAAGLSVEVLQGEAAALPVPDTAYDVVLSVFAAIFAPDPEAALAEMARVLKPSGRLVMTVWLPGGPAAGVARIAGEAVAAATGTGGPPRLAWHDLPAVREVAGRVGLSVEAAEHSLVFTAESPEAHLAEEMTSHPAALATMAVLEPVGAVDATRERMLAVLREGNEDPAAFRGTSRYLVLTMRHLPAAAG